MDAQGWKFQLTEKTNEITRLKHTRGTNKIIIVGHPLSGYEHVTQLLAESGMTPALPTLREGLSPQSVNSQICSAHGIPPLDEWQIDHHDEIKQLEVSPIWHGLVLDMVRSNMNQPLWGWADPSAIFLLDFWKSVSPNTTFILVYNHPRSALNVHGTQNVDDVREEYQSPERVLDHWKKYNEALLEFYQNNASQCLLVHAEQLQRNPFGMLDGINTVSGNELIRTNDDTDLQDSLHKSNHSLNYSSIPPEPINLSRFAKRKEHTSIIPQDATENPLEVFLAEQLLDHYPCAKDLYEELQAVATVPFHKKTSVEVGINMVWHAFHDLLNTNAHLSTENRSFKTKVDELIQEHADIQIALEAKQLANERLLKQSSELREELNRNKENSVLLQNKIEELEANEHISKIETENLYELKTRLLEVSRQKSQLEERLAQVSVEMQKLDAERKQENELLITQLLLIQEELQNIQIERKDKEQQVAKLIKQHEVQFAQLQEEKNNLCRQLDNSQRDSNRFCTEVKRHKIDINSMNEKLAQSRNELTSVNIELSRCNRDVARLNEFLSQRNAEIATNKTLLLQHQSELSELARELSIRTNVEKEQKNQLDEQLNLIEILEGNQKPRLTGAKDRQQNELNYQIGGTFIHLSRSFLKWKLLFYPVYIRSFLSNYAARKQPEVDWLPPLTEYQDYEEALKAKAHLSYQLGVTWQQETVKGAGYFSMRRALMKTYKKWKLTRRQENQFG